MPDPKTKQVIKQLKKIREEKGYTCQTICDMVEKSGSYVSLSSVKRVFAEGSEDQSFRYNETIKPIVIALLDINEPQSEQDITSTEQDTISTLKAVISIKEQLQQQAVEEYEKKLTYIKSESVQKHEHIVELTAQIKQKDRIIFWLSFVLIAVLLLMVVALIIDRIDPSLGYFWRTVSASINRDTLAGNSLPAPAKMFLASMGV